MHDLKMQSQCKKHVRADETSLEAIVADTIVDVKTHVNENIFKVIAANTNHVNRRVKECQH